MKAQAEQQYDVYLPPYFAWPLSLAAVDQVKDWGHQYLRAGEIYGRTRGEKALVFILDTAGEFVHPDLVGNSLNRYGVNFSDALSLHDVQGHGTHCAGIVGATDNEIGVIGIAPGTHLVPIKVLNDGGFGLFTGIAKGVRYAADAILEPEYQDLPRIISMSLGGPTGSKELQEAIAYAIEKGCFVIAAAGNSGFEEGKNTVNYPGKYKEVITIASIGKAELPSRFSSAGPEVDLAAPGEAVYSTHKNGAYAYLSGTSMATPHVAGVCALILSLFPEIKTQAQLEQFLKAHAKDIYGSGQDDRTGAGTPILPDYADLQPEQPEEPEEPAPDPEPEPGPSPEEPQREKRTMLIPMTDNWKVFWKTRNEQNLRELYIDDLIISLTTTRPAPAVVDQLNELIDKYFSSRGFILPDGMDYQDAVYYAGLFLKLIVGRELEVGIYQIGGYDPDYRTVRYEYSTYAGRIKKNEVRQAGTFLVPMAIQRTA